MLNIEEQIKNSLCYGNAYDSTTTECKKCDASQRCEARCREKLYAESKPIETVETPQLSDRELVSQIATNQMKVRHPNSRIAKAAAAKEIKAPRRTPPKTPKRYDPGMPELKSLTMDELYEMATQRTNVDLEEIKKIASPQIQRMRVVMAIKESYEIK